MNKIKGEKHMNTVGVGDIGEMVAITKFTKKGFVVSKPLTNVARYDFIVEIQNKLYRVQVKTTESTKDEGAKMEFSTKTTNYEKGHWKSNRYSTEEIDLFFLYCLENDWSGLFIPDASVKMPSAISLRLTPTKNNQIKGINFAKDYEFEKRLGSLVQLAE